MTTSTYAIVLMQKDEERNIPMEKEKSHQLKLNILSIFLLIYLTSIFLLFFDRSFLYKSVIIVSPFFILTYFVSLKKIENIVLISILILFFTIALLSCSLAQGRNLIESLYLIVLSILNIWLAYVLNKEPLPIKTIQFYLITLFFLCFLLMIYGINPNQFFPKSSRNTFSWLVLTGASLFYFIYSRNNALNSYPIWPALLGFLISLWGQGRSGIITTCILLCGVVFCNLGFQKNWKKVLYASGILVFFVFVAFLFIHFRGADISNVIARFSREGLRETQRISIIKNYLENITTMKAAVFGFNIKNDPFMEHWNFNLHNSFLQLHYRIGISGFFLILLIVKGIIRKSKKSNIFSFIALALLLRILTDTVAFIQPFDFLLYYFIFDNSAYVKCRSKKPGI